MLPSQAVEKSYEDERVNEIQEKALKFLSKLYSPCKDGEPKEFDMYVTGKNLGNNATETEYIVNTLSRAELIKHDKTSDRISITNYGIMIMKGAITVGYAPIL